MTTVFPFSDNRIRRKRKSRPVMALHWMVLAKHPDLYPVALYSFHRSVPQPGTSLRAYTCPNTGILYWSGIRHRMEFGGACKGCGQPVKHVRVDAILPDGRYTKDLVEAAHIS